MEDRSTFKLNTPHLVIMLGVAGFIIACVGISSISTGSSAAERFAARHPSHGSMLPSASPHAAR